MQIVLEQYKENTQNLTAVIFLPEYLRITLQELHAMQQQNVTLTEQVKQLEAKQHGASLELASKAQVSITYKYIETYVID